MTLSKLKEQFRGTGQVFRFTLGQLFKSRATLLTMLFTLIFAAGTLPVMTLINGGSAANGGVRVYFDNRVGLSVPDLEARLDEAVAPRDVTLLSGPLPEEEADALGLTLAQTDGAMALTVSWNDGGEEILSTVYPVGSAAYDCVNGARLKESGLTEGEIALLAKGVTTNGLSWDDRELSGEDFSFSGGDEGFDSSRYGLQIGYSVVIMMFCLYSVGYVVRSVIEEKQSKLVDLLLVSVRPAALLFGKVLAVLCFVFLYMLVLFGGVFLSYAVTSRFLDVSAAPGALNALLDLHPDASSLAVILVTGVLGCVAFGLLGGLCGAGCSNIDESGGAMSTCTMLIMAGYMFSIFLPMTSGTLLNVFCVIPVLSMFTAPLQFMAGHIGFGTVALSWVLQIACIFFLILLSAAVYSSLIMYNGKRLGFGRILAMAGVRKEAKK